MTVISNIIEPNRLLLSWQPMSDDQNRTRCVVGEILRQDDNYILRYLVDSNDFRLALESNFTFYPAFRDTAKDHTSGVLETFMLRLPPRKREDFRNFLQSLRLPPDATISDFALLGYSEARLPGDGFSIINPFDNAPAPCQFLSEVAGYRYYPGPSMNIQIGEPVTFEADPENKYDPMAIKIMLRGELIGYVNRCQTAPFHQWMLNNNLHAAIEKINGTPTKPRLLLFVEVS
ncbi:HIRAN domain-containing protein [Oryzomonas rubra]|uniref:HIRAN domain-containing protein n=1 Tax=Oryzomonas rubra TaxID=2509454 RepID=A0A5A9XEN0_9BACT|nr:HIRAN domain-containing protein [Oryzomonas rubra]KAA0891652.1 hypothetical protein ET418_09395 [Oryzomonas rubra]